MNGNEQKKKRLVFNRPYNPKPFTQEDMKRGFGGPKDNRQRFRGFGIPQQRQQPQRPEKQPQEEEPYWSAQQWEEWATGIYNNSPELREFLPAWIIEAMEPQE